jgi:type I restriction enzyme R subunit
VLEKHLEALFLERIEGNEKIFMQMMNDPEFRALVFEKLLISIYENLHNHDKPTDA